jgi:hypothetical protein
VNRRPWIRQGLVGTLFLVAGMIKLITPVSVLAMQSPFPGEILRVIGGFELLGALWLLLSVLLRIFPELKAVALGLTLVAAGAVVTTVAIGADVLAPILVTGVLTGVVIYGRRHVAQASERRLAPS